MPEANVSSNIQRMHQIPRYRQWKDEEDGKVFKCKYERSYMKILASSICGVDVDFVVIGL